MRLDERLELQIPVRKLLIGLLISVIPISLAALWAINHSQNSLERTIGSHFKTVADVTASDVSQYIHDRVVDVAEIAVEPAILNAVTSANAAWKGRSDTEITDRIAGIDKQWTAGAAEALASQILGSPASRLLRRHRELDPRLLRITVTDEKGATVAATHKPLDYFQADEQYWQDIYAQGRGEISVTDILYDEATKSHYVGIGLPLMEEGTNRFIGTLDALIDVTHLFPLVNRAQLGPSGRMLLVKDDGTVIGGPQATLAANLKSEEWDAIREAMGTLRGRQTGYVTAAIGGNRTLIGFADTGLKQQYPKLGWAVVIAQETREALAPIRTVGRLIALVSLLGLAAVTLLAAWFMLHRAEPITDLSEVEHPLSTRGQHA